MRREDETKVNAERGEREREKSVTVVYCCCQ